MFVKSHYCKPVQVAGVRNVFGVYIYRNPLDVFLSGLNYVYINAEKYESFKKYFLNETPKDVDTIVADGELAHYFDRFVRDDGIAVFRPFSGGWAEGVTNWRAAETSSNGAIACLSYDDVVNNTERVVGDLMRRIGVAVDDDAIVAGLARARGSTKVDGKFYWKGRAGVHREYLSPEQIGRFYSTYQDVLDKAGVQFAP